MRHLTGLVALAILGAQDGPRPGVAPAVCGNAELTEFGLDCPAEEPCPVYLELSAVEAAGGKLFLTGNLHTEAATLWSVLLASEDEGKTWSEPHERIRGAALDLIQFVDSETGWVAGQTVGALPKEPFLLKTTDGGKSWRRVPVYEEFSYGTVDQFRFESKTHGWLVVDKRGLPNERFQRMETMTGGDSWMIREMGSKPFPAARPRASDWRVRVDAGAKVHRVEKRVDGRWAVVTSFPVRDGECKPDAPQVNQ